MVQAELRWALALHGPTRNCVLAMILHWSDVQQRWLWLLWLQLQKTVAFEVI